jgi:hypothetical protein
MWFEANGKTVFSPKNAELNPIYSVLEKIAPQFSGSRFFDELVDAYLTADEDLSLKRVKEDLHYESTAS